MSLSSRLNTRGRALLFLLTFLSFIFLLTFLSSTTVRERVKEYATYPSFLRPQAQKGKTTVANLEQLMQCPPDNYSAGRWERRPSAQPIETEDDALRSSGFEGCAYWGNYHWHLGLLGLEDLEPFHIKEWRGNVSAYDWIPGQGCSGYEGTSREELIRGLVEDGGWLILGGKYLFQRVCLLFGGVDLCLAPIQIRHLRDTSNHSHACYIPMFASTCPALRGIPR